MKKIILLPVLIFTLNLVTKAQPEKQFTAVTNIKILKHTALTEDNTFSKNLYSAAKNGPDKDYAFYMHRSKNLRITGVSLLGAGLILGVSGLLVSSSNSNPNNYDSRDQTIASLFIASAATGIASIPFMVLASVNKQKAKLMLSNQKTGFGVPAKVSKDITGITLALPIGR